MVLSKSDFIIDLDAPQEEVISSITKYLEQKEQQMHKEGEVALNFLIKKKGEKDKNFQYNLNKNSIGEAEREITFPLIIEEILKKELNPKIAKNQKLVTHIKEELKKDPYWSNRALKLIKTIKEKQMKG